MKMSELFTKTADKLEKPGAWVKGSNAKDKLGHDVQPESTSATCWCVEGALRSIPGAPEFWDANLVLERLVFKDMPAFRFNDLQRTAAPVVAKLREAAQLALAEGL